MKIPLNLDSNGNQSSKAAQMQVLEREILAAKKGDWSAKNSIARTFMPLLQSLAEKRADESRNVNDLIEAGKQGLFLAVKKFKPSQGVDKFQIFAVDYIESGMDNQGGSGGFFARLFGKS